MTNSTGKQQPRKAAVTTIRKLRKFATENNLNATDISDMGEFANSTTWKWLHADPVPNLHWRSERAIREFLKCMNTGPTRANPFSKLNQDAEKTGPTQDADMPAIEVAMGGKLVKDAQSLRYSALEQELSRKLREQEFLLAAYRKGEL
mgnify:CR=1 FL=1|jgi:hypothetical protein